MNYIFTPIVLCFSRSSWCASTVKDPIERVAMPGSIINYCYALPSNNSGELHFMNVQGIEMMAEIVIVFICMTESNQ